MAIPGRAPEAFPEILEKLWWPLDKALTLDDVRCSAEICLLDAIKHGTTALVDHHASPNAIPGSMDEIASAVEASGLRAVLCYEVTDRGGIKQRDAGIQENLSFIDRVKRERPADGRIAATFGLHASLTLSDEALDACRSAVPDGVGFHIHVAESEADQYDSLEKSGLRVVDRLHRHGILGSKSIAAHAVHVDAREMALLAEMPMPSSAHENRLVDDRCPILHSFPGGQELAGKRNVVGDFYDLATRLAKFFEIRVFVLQPFIEEQFCVFIPFSLRAYGPLLPLQHQIWAFQVFDEISG